MRSPHSILYRRLGNLLYSLLVRMLVSKMEAQEAMQDIFVAIWQRAHKGNPAVQPRAQIVAEGVVSF